MTRSCANRRRWLRWAALCPWHAGILLATPRALGQTPAADAASVFTNAALESRLRRVAPDLWCLQGHDGDADGVNRGWIANTVVARQGQDLWFIGSGPSPAFGHAVGRWCARRWPRSQLRVLSPWAHPESVLGIAGLSPVEHLAHAEVAHQMRQRCPGCLERLAHRMGPAALDLGPSPIRVPEVALDGEGGRVGPFDWARFQRAPEVTVIAWRHRSSGVVFAPGLVWGAMAPDARDGTIECLLSATIALQQQCLRWGTRRLWGQQGTETDAHSVDHTLAYWRGLQQQAESGVEQGEDSMTPPGQLTGVPPDWLTHAHHALNWQRVWRQVESRWLQRSLR